MFRLRRLDVRKSRSQRKNSAIWAELRMRSHANTLINNGLVVVIIAVILLSLQNTDNPAYKYIVVKKYVVCGLCKKNSGMVGWAQLLIIFNDQLARYTPRYTPHGRYSISSIIALWGWFSRDVLPVTSCEHGPPSIATVHFSKFSIATNILFN